MKAMESRLLRFSFRLLMLSLCGLLSGCQSSGDWSLTYKLWNNEALHAFKMPASEPRIQLFADERQSDVLVVYDELAENSGAIRRRAFFVNRNLDRMRAGRKPRFVRPKASDGLKPIPLIPAGSSEKVPASGLSVVMKSNQQEFVVHSDGRELGPVSLPTYGSTGSFTKGLLTPLAVTGDTLIVGTVVGLYMAVAYAHSGFTIHTCP
jgi:hypothetical protein